MAKKNYKGEALVGEPVIIGYDVAGGRAVSVIGIIHSLQSQKNVAIVEFDDLAQAEYKLKDLTGLYPQKVIMQGLISNWDQSNADYAAVLNIYRLVKNKKKKEALLLAFSNESTRFFCLTNCEALLKMKRHLKNKPKQKRCS